MFNCVDWGVIEYSQALHLQEQIFQEKINQKVEGIVPTCDLILCEHLPVFTLGKHGKTDNLLMTEQFLNERNIQLVRTSRGGDITFHGLGQITGYPIVDLQQLNLGLKDYIWQMEEAIVLTIADYGIKGERLQGATGVWLEPLTSRARKICAIGVRASRYVTMHGFALNVNTELNYFNYINPCGFTDKGVTSIEKEMGYKVPLDEVKHKLWDNLCCCFGSRVK